MAMERREGVGLHFGWSGWLVECSAPIRTGIPFDLLSR